MPGRILFEAGTHTDVLARTDGLNHAPRVLANILAPVLITMLASGLEQTVIPGGLLILGGILDTQAQDVIQAAAARDLSLVETLQSGDWVVLVLRKGQSL